MLPSTAWQHPSPLVGVELDVFLIFALHPKPSFSKMPPDRCFFTFGGNELSSISSICHPHPQHTIDQYDLNNKAKNGHVYVEIRKAIYGLPQAGTLANKLLKERLPPKGYFDVPHTPGLRKHISRPIESTLVVDDFGVKYAGMKHADHLINALKRDYNISED